VFGTHLIEDSYPVHSVDRLELQSLQEGLAETEIFTALKASVSC
jgi:hypothetical protein